MSQISPDKASMALKILYTLHGIESQKYVVKPSRLYEVSVFREIGLGTVDMKLCLDAIREASPDFASICDTHEDEYAVYSADYAEDGLPLQSHGRVSQSTMIDATGKSCSSKLLKEQSESLIHLLPVRKPKDMIADFINSQKLKSEPIDMMMLGSDSGKHPSQHMAYPPQSLMNPSLLHSLPSLPPPVQIPASLTSDINKPSLRSDPILPSSPPVRTRSTKGSSDSQTGSHSNNTTLYGATGSSVKRAYAENSMSKRRKASSPKAEGESQCSNCGVAAASTWRRIESSDGKKDLLCNACGLYYKSKHVMRPSFLWDKMRTRGETDAAAASASSSTSSQTPNTSSSQSIHSQSQAKATSSQTRQSSHHNHQQYPSTRQELGLNESQDSAMHDTNMLWSQGTSHLMTSDVVDISDRLLDKPRPSNDKENKNSVGSISTSQLENFQGDAHLSMPSRFDTVSQDMKDPEPPRTPEPKHTESQPLDSIQKLFDINTPDPKNNLMMPGSGSASKWLRRVMNPANFEDFSRSPTPRKMRNNNDLSILTSSPPTSSNLFSEISDWTMYGTASPHHNSPRPVKLFKDDTAEIAEK